MKIIGGNTAAIIIDYQERLLPVISEKERILQNTVKLIKGLQILSIPMIITQQYTKGLGNTVSEITEAAGTADFIDKLTFSCFQNSQVRESIEKNPQKNTILLCGIETHICVLQTALDLKAAGYQPVMVTDCMSSRKEADHQTALQRAIQENIVVTTYESVLFELMVHAKCDGFKQISALIK